MGFRYTRRVLLGLDRFFNALFNGKDDETISSRVGKLAEKGNKWGLFFEKIIDFFFWKGHCRDSKEVHTDDCYK